jgi:hypothetical protein
MRTSPFQHSIGRTGCITAGRETLAVFWKAAIPSSCVWIDGSNAMGCTMSAGSNGRELESFGEDAD